MAAAGWQAGARDAEPAVVAGGTRTFEPLRVAASIFPLGNIAQEIGGDAVHVDVLLPAGATPHGYEPTPVQAEMLASADLLLVVGMGADPWAQASAAASGNAKLATLAFADVIDPATIPGGLRGDPHLWLDPVLVRQYAAALARRLIELRPDHADSVRARGLRYDGELAALDRAYREEIGALRERKFIALHAAFTYIAARYGLTQVSIFDAHMHEPGPRAMEHVLEAVREEGVRAVFREPQMPATNIAWLSEETGVRIGLLDPMGNPHGEGYDSYLAIMRSNLAELVRAMSD
jgi:zinc transport system substrate-binding protein